MLVLTAAVPDPLHHVTWDPGTRNPEKTRLLAALCHAERRLGGLAAKRGPSDAVVAACNGCLRSADVAAIAGAPYRAWDSLHQFDEEALAALSDEEREARWCSMCAEAQEKLGEQWRGAAAEAVCKLRREGRSVPLHLLRELHSHLVTAAQNKQHRLEILEKRFVRAIALWLSVCAGLVFVVSAALVVGQAEGSAARLWGEWFVLGIPAGALGGALSMAFALGRADLAVKTPDLRLMRLVSFTRPIVGGAVAILVILLVGSNVVKVAGLDGTAAVVVFCVVGGFSERWFLRIVQQLEK